MNHIQRTFVTLAALLVVVVGSLTVLGAQEGAQESMSVEGELLSVDTDAMTFTILASDASEHVFAYTAETEVTGAQEGAAGLSTVTGSQVVIAYQASTEEGGTALATKIDVRS